MIERIRTIIEHTVHELYPDLRDPIFSITQPPGSRGDLATNVSFAIAKIIKKSPDDVAQTFARQLLSKQDTFDSVESENGFLNLILNDQILSRCLEEIILRSDRYGYRTKEPTRKARVEFISANPTGPLHIGNARGGPLGDVIANVLEQIGYNVLREYYHNDIGNQVSQFGTSILNVSLGKPLSGEEYKGEYIKQLAHKIRPTGQTAEQVGQKAVEIILEQTLDAAKDMGIKFDKVYHESKFVQSGQSAKVLDSLKTRRLLKNQQGAVWFAPNDEFLKDRESVVIKSDGQLTYFANDIAYHQLKFSEGYDLVVDIVGADHHGHILRLQAIASALGEDVSKFTCLLYQWVRIRRGNQVVEMSKRAGNFVTAKEVLDDVGKDAFRFFMLMHDANTHLDFDLELAKKRSQDNPVYYVQYAAVRAKAIIKKIQNSKFKIQNENSKFKIGSVERRLIVQLAKLPSLIEEISQTFKVHLLTRYAIDTARLFHDFYETSPVLENNTVNQTRLKIVKATLVVLQNTLKLCGVSVPTRM